MNISIRSHRLAAVLALIALAVVGVALPVATNGASAAGSGKGGHRTGERLVVRGEDTVEDGPCHAGVCKLELADGAFRGTVGTGPYGGTIDLHVAEAFANGEDGLCAPIRGNIVLGAGSADRLVVGVRGDSCQDGAGDLTQASFTGIAHAGRLGAHAAASAWASPPRDRVHEALIRQTGRPCRRHLLPRRALGAGSGTCGAACRARHQTVGEALDAGGRQRSGGTSASQPA
jgi:hypothetical protein